MKVMEGRIKMWERKKKTVYCRLVKNRRMRKNVNDEQLVVMTRF